MKQFFSFRNEMTKYTLYGFLFGLCFPLVALWFDITRQQLPLNLTSLVKVHRDNPIHFMVDTAPIFLGLFAMFIGINLDKLKAKNSQVIAASKIRQDFLANMSHEIRTPMVGVIGMIDLLFKNTELNPLQKEYVTIIHQSSLNLLDILNQILDLSKIEAGKFTLSPKPTNFNNLISQNINLFLATSKSKDLYLQTELSSEIPEILLIDANRFTQIMSNLIGNAIKFTKKGGVTVKASLVTTKKENHTIKIEVIDSGIGISQKDQKELFQQFSQFHNEAILAGEGSGLGLTICKKLVDLMNGSLGVQSTPDAGSRFWFTFKTKEVPKLHDPILEKPLITSSYNIHVLLVEDSETSIIVSKQILKYLGCTVDIANDGSQAIAMFEEGKYHLILMDINLPEINGIETSKLIRKKSKNTPPIIALTSNALPGDSDRFIAQGLDDYITKPYTTEIMNIKLQNWFGDHDEYH
ncbi:ATP-binding protein [Aquimarina sp. W85]|uniref:ATP-binding protein n=1 Tax=Aquimarina rhodophyticola TaxID=3342246 RepID=UPI00366F93A7